MDYTSCYKRTPGPCLHDCITYSVLIYQLCNHGVILLIDHILKVHHWIWGLGNPSSGLWKHFGAICLVRWHIRQNCGNNKVRHGHQRSPETLTDINKCLKCSQIGSTASSFKHQIQVSSHQALVVQCLSGLQTQTNNVNSKKFLLLPVVKNWLLDYFTPLQSSKTSLAATVTFFSCYNVYNLKNMWRCWLMSAAYCYPTTVYYL